MHKPWLEEEKNKPVSASAKLPLPWLLLLFLISITTLHSTVASSSSANTTANSTSNSSTSSIANGTRPASVSIGVLVDWNSMIGASALTALRLAVENINNSSSLLNGTALLLHIADTNCSTFQGMASAIDLLATEVLAIAGPQTSMVSHAVGYMAEATSVPMITFSATDPALSEYQYPYIIRVTNNDFMQMAAIADIIGYYGWREVVAVFTDDDYGKNGIDALGDLLDDVDAKIVYKAGFAPGIDMYGIGAVLTQLAKMEARVFVVHMQPKVGEAVFAVANYLRLVSLDYVWIVTDAIIEFLDSSHTTPDFIKSTQGVIGTRSYIPDSDQLQSFIKQRNEALMTTDYKASSYELHAYDSIWLFAYAINSFLENNNSIEFIPRTSLPANGGGGSDLSNLKVFKDGYRFLQEILEANFSGVSGFVKFDKRGDRIGSSFEVVNIIGSGLRVVGYWTNETGCTTNLPLTATEMMMNNKATTSGSSRQRNQKLQDVIWPGGSSTKPRGWVVPKNGRPLLIGVPWKTVYQEFVSTSVDINNITQFHGFCISVFEAAVTNLPYVVPYVFKSFGDGSSTPSYDDLVEKVANKELDAVVGDITITTKRSKVVDFTQPYATSGLVVVVPVKGTSASYAWAFMRPFTPTMWCATGVFFLFTGLVIWMLEHKKNQDFRGRRRKQVVTTLWFIFSTLFFSQREKVKSTLGRAVLIIWLFVVLIITSSYTASLSSILTIQQLMPTIKGIAGLIASTVPIGYQAGSFVEDYLLQLGVDKDRLVPLSTLDSYAEALEKGSGYGGVGAIVDELPYVQSFLSLECDYTIAGQEFTKSGWGFAFPKGSQLAFDISTAILTLAESGELQRIHEEWLHKSDCSSQVAMQSNELHFRSFWGLFLITGSTSILCIVCYYARMAWQYHQQMASQPPFLDDGRPLSQLSRGTSFLKSFASFVSEPELPEGSSNSRSKKGSMVLNPSSRGLQHDDVALMPDNRQREQKKAILIHNPIIEEHSHPPQNASSSSHVPASAPARTMQALQRISSWDLSVSSRESSKGPNYIDRVEISPSCDQQSCPIEVKAISIEEESSSAAVFSVDHDWRDTVVNEDLSIKQPTASAMASQNQNSSSKDEVSAVTSQDQNRNSEDEELTVVPSQEQKSRRKDGELSTIPFQDQKNKSKDGELSAVPYQDQYSNSEDGKPSVVPSQERNSGIKNDELSTIPSQDQSSNRKDGELSAIPSQDQNSNKKDGELSAIPFQYQNSNRKDEDFSAFPSQDQNSNRKDGELSAAPSQDENSNKKESELSAVQYQDQNSNKKDGEISAVPSQDQNGSRKDGEPRETEDIGGSGEQRHTPPL